MERVVVNAWQIIYNLPPPSKAPRKSATTKELLNYEQRD